MQGSCDWQAHCGIFRAFGAGVTIRERKISVSTGSLSALELDAAEAGMYLPHALVLASVANGKSKIGNLHSLPRRHLTRASKLAGELGKMGAKIEREGDSFSITGGKLVGARIDHSKDPAVAMACAAAGARGTTVLDGVDCVERAYPGFFSDLAALGASVR